MIRPFDPSIDQDKPILELKSVSVKGQDQLRAVPTDVSFEVAAQTPWYYVVEDKDYQGTKGGAGSGNYGHAGRPGKVGGSASGGGGGGGGPSTFNSSEWSSLDVGTRRDQWESLTARQRDRMTNAAKRVPENQKAIIAHAGDRPDLSNDDVKKAITDRIDQLVMIDGEEFIPGKDAKMVRQTVNEMDDALAAIGVEPELRYQLAMEAADALVAQDRESLGRTLGDHGIHHLRGNIDTAMAIIDAHPDVDTPNDIAETYIAQVFHDTGYMTDPSKMFLDEGHARWGAQHYDANIRPLVERALGKRAAGEISHIIRTHASTDVDWEEDVLASASRVADNLALFHDQKLPPLFRFVPSSTSVLEDLGAGRISASQARNMLRRKVKGSNLSGSIKSQLMGAVGEVSGISPKFILGMLGGSIGKIEWKGDRLRVHLKRNAEATRLQKVLDLGQRQFAKFAKTYGYDPGHFLESLKFEFKNSQGQTVLESVIEAEKMLEALKALGLSKAEREEIIVGIKAAAEVYPAEITEALKGGPGSGNYGHAGRPGQRGGSAPGGRSTTSLAKSIFDKAVQEEPAITEIVTGVAEEVGGRMEGLDYRLKSRESLARKISSEAADMGVSPARAAREITDSVRYTMVLDHRDLTRGAIETQRRLAEDGWVQYDTKWRNYFDPGDAYDGYNTVFVNKKTGQRFELQFHTPKSLEIKERVHKLYEEARTLPAGKRRTQLVAQMTEMWNDPSYTRPVNWQSLPGIRM